MIAFAIAIGMILTPFIAYFTGHDKVAALTGLYVVFSIPSFWILISDTIKSKRWPKISRGPSMRFGKWG